MPITVEALVQADRATCGTVIEVARQRGASETSTPPKTIET
jgi:hypothetical protein